MSQKSSQNGKKPTGVILMAVCLVVAVALIVFMVISRGQLAAQNKTLTADLADSQAKWQAVSAEKETLQSELTETNDQLREAQTSLAESEQKATELESQVSDLSTQKDVLAGELSAAQTENTDLTVYVATTTDMYDAYIATTTDLIAEKEAFIATTTDLLETTQAENAALTEQLAAAQASIASSDSSIRAAKENQLTTLKLYLGYREEDLVGATGDKADRIQADIDDLTAKIAALEAELGE